MSAFCSEIIRFTFTDPLLGSSSSSMPGKRDLNTCSIFFLSSALAGIPATILPSFLAASKTLSHSTSHDGFDSAARACDLPHGEAATNARTTIPGEYHRNNRRSEHFNTTQAPFLSNPRRVRHFLGYYLTYKPLQYKQLRCL